MTDQTDMKLAYVFATPLVELRMPAHEQLCETLRSMFLERAAEGDTYRNETQRSTQHGALFESKFDLFRWQDPPVQALATFCHRAVASTVNHLSDYSPEEMSALNFDYHAWFHVTRTGGFQGLHNHENASWSGIFCVDSGDVDPAHPESGLVRFHDARGASNMYMDAGNRRLQAPAQLVFRRLRLLPLRQPVRSRLSRPPQDPRQGRLRREPLPIHRYRFPFHPESGKCHRAQRVQPDHSRAQWPVLRRHFLE